MSLPEKISLKLSYTGNSNGLTLRVFDDVHDLGVRMTESSSHDRPAEVVWSSELAPYKSFSTYESLVAHVRAMTPQERQYALKSYPKIESVADLNVQTDGAHSHGHRWCFLCTQTRNAVLGTKHPQQNQTATVLVHLATRWYSIDALQLCTNHWLALRHDAASMKAAFEAQKAIRKMLARAYGFQGARSRP